MSEQKPEILHQMGDLKITEDGGLYWKNTLIQGKTFNQPVNLPDVTTEPTPMLYQPPYYLSEANFEKIRRPRSVLIGFAWSCIIISITNGLRLLLKLSESSYSKISIDASKLEIYTSILILLLGIFFLVLSSFFSRERQKIFKDIETHQHYFSP